MPTALIRLSALGLVIPLLAGCGGGSGGNGGGGGGGGNPTAVTFTFPNPAPTAVAAKIGSGSFAVQTLSSSKLTLSIPSGSTGFAVAYLCPALTDQGSGFVTKDEFVFEGSTLDGTSFTLPCPVPGGPFPIGQTGTLTGSVDASAISGAIGVDVVALNAVTLNVTGAPVQGNFSFAAPTGTDRVQLFAFGTRPSPTEAGPVLAARDFSSQAVPGALNSGNSVVFTTADATTLQPITVTNKPLGTPSVSVSLQTGPTGQSLFDGELSGQGQYRALPAGALESGDYYLGIATSHDQSTGRSIGVFNTWTNAGAVTFTLPAPWSYAGPAPAALPTFQINYSGFSGKNGVIETGSVDWPKSFTEEDSIFVNATGNYLNGSASVPVPDLSGLPGFLASPPSGVDVYWTASISQASFGAQLKLPPNGTESFVGTDGSFIVP